VGQRGALVVVDIQNDFCPGGAIPVPEGDAVIPRVNRTAALFSRRGLPVIFTRDWHPRVTKHFKEFGGAWPPHCVQGTKGARFHPDLQVPKGAFVLSKGMDPEVDSYSGFQAFTENGRDLESTLRELAADELFVCGLATDYCVRATALDGLRRGFNVRILRDAIRGVDAKAGDSETAIKEMRAHGAQFKQTRGLAKLLPKTESLHGNRHLKATNR
jgi:nicotinamidase/pyrazinamidase